MAAFAKPLLPAGRFISRNLKNNKMDIQELVKNEIEFCNEIDCEKNEHGQFIYESKNGKSTMNLPYVLQEYKQWLIDKRLIKEVQ